MAFVAFFMPVLAVLLVSVVVLAFLARLVDAFRH